MSASFVANDTGSAIEVTCKTDTGAVINLSDRVVNLRWEDLEGTLNEVEMVVVSAAEGRASYKFAAGELFSPAMKFEVRITDQLGAVLTSLEVIEVEVREPLA